MTIARRASVLIGALSVAGVACNAILDIGSPNIIDGTEASESGQPAESGSDGNDVGDSNGGGDVRDGAVSDAPVDSLVPFNFLDNGDFENGCQGWTPNSAVASASTIAHSGTGSCRVCAQLGQSVYTLGQYVDGTRLEAGATYVGEAWLRAPATDASTSLFLAVELNHGPATPTFAGGETPMGTFDTTWRSVTGSVTYKISDAGTKVLVEILNRSTDNGCFLVDDVTLVRKP